MGVLKPMPDGAAERLAVLLEEARGRAAFPRVQCVWLRASLGLSAPQIATALGGTASHVRHVQAAYLRDGESALRPRPRGGRHHAHLTADEEAALLVAQAAQGAVAVAAPVRQAYQERLGRPVPAAVAYRALHRQGWRKVAPRPTHPQADPAAREALKKAA